MAELVLTCPCGQRMKVPESSLGSEGRCPKCGQALLVSEANTEPLEQRTEPEATVCARCGKAFKGDWDRNPTTQGTFCHVCYNLADAEIDRGPAPKESAEYNPAGELPTLGLDSSGWEKQSEAVELRQRHKAEEWRKRKKEALVIGGAFIMTMLVIFLWPESEQAAAPAEPVEKKVAIPENFAWAYYALTFLIHWVGRGLTLYLALNFFNKLPNDEFAANLIAVGGVALLWAGCYLFLPIVGWLAGLVVLYFIYEFSCGEFLMLSLFGFLVDLMMWVLELTIFGGIALLFL